MDVEVLADVPELREARVVARVGLLRNSPPIRYIKRQ
jgi:hypothetical protein